MASYDLRLRGGVRVIYFYYNPAAPLYLLMVYAKAVREDVAPEAKQALAGAVARIKHAMGDEVRRTR